MSRATDATGATRRSMVTTARNSDTERAAATETVKRRALDDDDAQLILDALGLTDTETR